MVVKKGEEPWERFNRVLGPHVSSSGRWSSPTANRRAARGVAQDVANNRYKQSTSAIKRPGRRTSGVRSGRRYNTGSGIESTFERVTNDIIADWNSSANKQAAVNRVAEEQAQEAENPSIMDRVVSALTGSPTSLAAGNEGLATTPVGNVLYQAGRLPNATFQALEDLAMNDRNASQERGFLEEGGHIFNTLMGGLKTGWGYEEGVSGGGQVYEALKENPTSLLHSPLTAFEEAHPNWEQALAITTGVASELALDPYNVVAPAVPSIIRNTGAVLTREGLQTAAQAAGRQALEDGLSAAPSLFGRSPLHPDMILARTEAAIDDAINQTVLTVSRGGAPHARSLGGSAYPGIVADKWGQSVIDSISGEADEAIQRIITDPNRMTVGNINARRAASRDFDEFWTNLTGEMSRNGMIPTGSVDEVIAVLKGSPATLGKHNTVLGGMINKVWTDIRNGHFVELQPHIDQVYKAVENPITRTVGMRIGKKVIPVPVVGRAFAYAGDTLGKIPGLKGIDSIFYEKAFSGLFANKISRASAYGVKGLDNFMRELEKLAKGFTPEEGKELFKALGDSTFDFGGRLSSKGESLDDALTWLRKEKDERFFDELQEGARSIDDEFGNPLKHKQYDPNYQFMHLKGGTKGNRARFNEGRQKQWETYKNYIGYGIEEARKKGLRPVDDAFEAAQLHYMDSANRITNSYLWQDLAANYGSMPGKPVTGISATEATERGLQALEYNKLSASFKQAMKDSGGKFYIPNEMYDMGRQFDQMMDWSTASMGQFGRSFNKVINQFKLWTTLPYPGFHVRNFVGDTMMGMLDGVPPYKYTEVMRKYAANRAGRAANFEIFEGYSLSFNQLMKQYRDEANSSYLKVDVGLTSTKTAGRIAGIGRTVGKKVRAVSDDRELLPRVTHYVTALREEARALWNSGMRDTNAIMAQAKDAALWRVNHYKFDYNALMPWERTLKATVFPFYTYTRKAIPTLVEQMFVNPHYFQAINRFMMDNDGSAADQFNYRNVPQFWRDFGFGMMTDEAEPLGLTGEIFPTNALDVLSSNSLGEASRDLISMANPAFQIPYEWATKSRAFDDRPIQGGNFDYLMSKIPFVGDVQERFSNLPGVPGESPYPVTGENPWSWDKWISDRMLGAGISLRRASEGQQEQQANTNYDTAVEAPISDYRQSQDRFGVSMDNTTGMFKITDKYGEINLPMLFSTPDEAIAWAEKNLPAPQHANVPTVNGPPNMQQIMELLASQ